MTLGLALALAITSSMFMTGCATTGSTTAAQKQQLIDDTAVTLRAAARNGAMMAIEDDPGSARWFAFSHQAIGAFLTGKDWSPMALQAALQSVPVKELKQKWIKYAVYNIIDLYQVFYGRYVQGQVQGNAIAKKFLEAIQDGFAQALLPVQPVVIPVQPAPPAPPATVPVQPTQPVPAQPAPTPVVPVQPAQPVP